MKRLQEAGVKEPAREPTFAVKLTECFLNSQFVFTGNCWVNFGLSIKCFQCLLGVLCLFKNMLQIRCGTCQVQLSSNRHTKDVLINEEWTSLRCCCHTHGDARTYCTLVFFLNMRCQRWLISPGRGKYDRDMYIQQCVQVHLVRLSIHVQRQQLSDSLFDGRWEWVLSTEGVLTLCFCECAMFMCVYLFMPCLECVMYLSCRLSGASRAPPLSFESKERWNLKQFSALVEWGKELHSHQRGWLNCPQSKRTKPVTFFLLFN